jgi:hypothetical protein
MIEFLSVQIRLNRITLEQIETRFGAEIRNQIKEKLN